MKIQFIQSHCIKSPSEPAHSRQIEPVVVLVLGPINHVKVRREEQRAREISPHFPDLSKKIRFQVIINRAIHSTQRPRLRGTINRMDINRQREVPDRVSGN